MINLQYIKNILLERNGNMEKIKFINDLFNELNNLELNNINKSNLDFDKINFKIASILKVKKGWGYGHIGVLLDCLETVFLVYNIYDYIIKKVGIEKIEYKIIFGKIETEAEYNHFWLELNGEIIDFTLFQYKDKLLKNGILEYFENKFIIKGELKEIYKGKNVIINQLEEFLLGNKIS